MTRVLYLATVLLMFTGSVAAQSNVAVYGVADGGLRFDHTNIGTLKSVGSGGESGTRWGLRGIEDLGNSLKATFIFEQGFDLSDNSAGEGVVGGSASAGFGGSSTATHTSTGSRLFSRIATVGLASAYGEVRFGRSYTPIHLVQATADPFFAGFVGKAGNIFVNNFVRNDNAVYYDSARTGGVQFSGVYQFGESTTDNQGFANTGQAKRGNDRYGAGATFLQGPAFLGVAYEHINSNLSVYNVQTFDVAGTYDLGFIKLAAIYWRTRNDNSNGNAAFGSTVQLDDRSYYAGFTIPYGAVDFLGGAGRLLDKSTSNANNTLGSPKANYVGLGVRYSLSKRTVLYASFAHLSLRRGPCGNAYQGFSGLIDATNFGLYNAGNLFGAPTTCAGGAGSVPFPVAPSNVNPSSFQVGIRHSF